MEITGITVGPLKTNCYIVESEQKHGAIIDPGFEPEKIAAKVRELGVNPRYILLTHGHCDHISAIAGLKKEFPEIQTVLLAKDKELCENPNLIPINISQVSGVTPDILLEDGDVIKVDGLSFEFMATPGHTPGSACILVEDKVFSGDTLMSRTYGRTDLYGGSTKDMKASLKRIGELEGDREIFPGHGPGTTLAIERYANPFLRKAMGLGIL